MEYNHFYENLGKRIKKLRNEAGYTQETFAEKVGISQDFLGKIEVAINKPGIRSLLKIANGLGITMSELTNFDEL